jgi:phosphatidylserine/phosphatidylglycerophosphate/cardiolipin synthase-like enzyme
MRVLREGSTCWRLLRARRAAFVVDGADYFSAAKSAMRLARRSIFLLGWSFDERTRLQPAEPGAERPDRIGRLLKQLVRERPELRIHALIWDQALPLALSHGFVAHLARFSLHDGDRLFYRLDGAHPPGACHHQKILVVDDALAFCGGMDFAANRWDTPAHADADGRRRLPNGNHYPPRHDVMMAVDDEAAAALGALCRERWRRATGMCLQPPSPAGQDPWPAALRVDASEVTVGLSRTEPGWHGRPETRENEALYRAAIRSARRWIYLESQYAASPMIAELLAARLAEPDGPDVVLVCSEESPGTLDRLFMDGPRDALLERLRQADRHGRFFAGAPQTANGRTIIIHSKVMIVDDRLLRIGSANLNRRSMGFDTECDLTIEAPLPGDPVAASIGARVLAFLHRLVAEHTGREAEEVAAAMARLGGLAKAVRLLNPASGRRLAPLKTASPGVLRRLVAHCNLMDPDGVGDAWRPWRRLRAAPP